MKLIDLIINIFNIRWGDRIYTNPYHQYKRFSSFINDVFHYCVIIDEVQKVYSENAKFALWAPNSTSYIACYIALILKNVDFYLIPSKMSWLNVSSIVAGSDINFMFTPFHVPLETVSSFTKIPYFKGIYNIEEENFVLIKKHTTGISIDNVRIQTKLNIVASDKYDANEIDEVLRVGFRVKKRKERFIAVFASGTESTFPHAIYFTDEVIYSGLMKLSDSNLLPNINGKNVYSRIDFSTAPVWCILWPLLSGSYFTFSLQESHVCIEDTETFERHWRDVSKKIYEIRWVGKHLLKTWLFWLFKWIARFQLKKHFNFGTKKDAIIILNASLAPRILNTIVRKLPVYTTYGMQEANQILAVNNYSSKEHCKENCVGEAFSGIYTSIRELNILTDEGSLIIQTDHLTDDANFEHSTYFDTRDHASLSVNTGKNLIYIYGKSRYAIKDSSYKGSNYENLERILKNVPYFREVLILEIGSDKHIFVFPNSDIIEGRFGLLDFNKFIRSYKSLINDRYGSEFITSVQLVSKDFLRTHNGRIRKAIYFVALHDSINTLDVTDL